MTGAAARVAVLLVAVALAGCGAGPTPSPSGSPSSAASVAPSVATTPAPSASGPVADGPTLGAWHALVRASDELGIVLVNGGPERGKPADDPIELWRWQGDAWTAVPADPDGPRWRNFGVVAWDPVREVLVLFGGLQSRGELDPIVWEWDGTSWRQAFRPGAAEMEAPGPREGAAMAWDPARGKVVLFGGGTPDGVLGDAWAWDGATWEAIANAGLTPQPRFPALLAADPTADRLILYGGHVLDGPEISVADTWALGPDGWTLLSEASPPGPRVNSAAVVHDGLGRLLLIAGGGESGTMGDVWAWTGEGWEELAPDAFPPRQAAGAAFDPATGAVVLSGGLDEPGTSARYSDLWTWTGEGPATRIWPAG